MSAFFRSSLALTYKSDWSACDLIATKLMDPQGQLEVKKPKFSSRF